MQVPCTPCGGDGYHNVTCCTCDYYPCYCRTMPVACDTCGGKGFVADEEFIAEPINEFTPQPPVKFRQ